jgi:PAS domain S-box-containing protein
MFRPYLDKRIVIGFLMALLILAGLAIYSFLSARRLQSGRDMVAHSHEVLYNAQRVLAVAVNIESAQRGYGLTGRPEFLDAFKSSVDAINLHYERLFRLSKGYRDEHQHILKLNSDIQQLIAFSGSSVNARKVNLQSAIDLNSSLEGKRLLDKIKDVVARFEKFENSLLNQRTIDNEEHIQNFTYSFIGLLFLLSAIVFGLFVTLNVQTKARNESEQRLVKASREIQDLYDLAPCGYHSLNADGVFVEINQTLVGWLGFKSKWDIIGKLKFTDVIAESDIPAFTESYPVFKKSGSVNNVEFSFKRTDGSEFPVILSAVAVRDEKGNFLKSRSNTFDNTERKQAELKIKNLNSELEAFTYSVSHDLRAPLRSIDGYTRILHEDYQSVLDNEGKRLTNVIVNNTKRMGKLIDDLLDFSRVGRKDLQSALVDMQSLVSAVAAEQVEHEPERKINIVIDELKSACADVEMMRQVWVNLISNAIKYTGKTKEALIRITSSEDAHAVTYKISDNGVGFDMQYSPKLFGVFQRLHRIQDFPGTGVGLAIVKRIVNRHNGSVWAESVLDEGATFYFTIPKHD